MLSLVIIEGRINGGGGGSYPDLNEASLLQGKGQAPLGLMPKDMPHPAPWFASDRKEKTVWDYRGS